MNTDTDHSDLAPPDQSIETTDDSQFLDLGGMSIHGSREERRAFFADLAKAQAGYGEIRRSRQVTVRPRESAPYTFDYAPLEEVLAGTLPSLNANGFYLGNGTSDNEDGKDLHTILTHKGGACLHMTMKMPGVTKPQDLGAQITYARRYSIQCVTGTSPEFDDDGNEGSGNKVEALRDKPAKSQKAPDPKPQAKPQLTPDGSRFAADAPLNGHKSEPPPPLKTTDPEPTLMTEEQANLIGSEFKRIQWGKMRAAEHVFKLTGMTSANMTKAAADILLFDLRDRTPDAKGA